MSRQGGLKMLYRQRSMRIACQGMYLVNRWLEKEESLRKVRGQDLYFTGLTMPRIW